MADSNQPPAPPGMEWDTNGPMGMPVLVPKDGPTSSEPVEPAGVPDAGDVTIDAGNAIEDSSEPAGAAGALLQAKLAVESAKDAYDAAIEAENCEFCISMLEALREADFETQAAGLEELRELEMMGTDVDEAAVQEAMEDFDIIPQFAQAVMQNADDE